MTTRRSFLSGLAGILTAGVAPAAIGSGVLMPVRKIVVPRRAHVLWGNYQHALEGSVHADFERMKNAMFRALLDNIEIGTGGLMRVGNEYRAVRPWEMYR